MPYHPRLRARENGGSSELTVGAQLARGLPGAGMERVYQVGIAGLADNLVVVLVVAKTHATPEACPRTTGAPVKGAR